MRPQNQISSNDRDQANIIGCEDCLRHLDAGVLEPANPLGYITAGGECYHGS